MIRTNSVLVALFFAACATSPAERVPVIERDVVYGHKDGMALTLDVHRPTAEPNGAGILFMVSGGWVSRWRDPDSTARRQGFDLFTNRGYTVFAVRHGSSPRYKVPDAHADVRRALAHIHANAGTYDIDPNRLGVYGYSAGGHLSLLLGLHGGDGESPAGDVAAVVAYFPPVDVRGWAGPNLRFPALDFDAKHEDSVSPVLYATPDDPPTLLLHGNADGLVPLEHSERMHAALREAGVETDFVVFEGAGHGFRGDDLDRSRQLMVDWFDRHLHQK